MVIMGMGVVVVTITGASPALTFALASVAFMIVCRNEVGFCFCCGYAF